MPPYPGGAPTGSLPYSPFQGETSSAGGATPPGLALSTLGSRHNGIFSALPCALVFPFCSASFRPESQRKKEGRDFPGLLVVSKEQRFPGEKCQGYLGMTWVAFSVPAGCAVLLRIACPRWFNYETNSVPLYRCPNADAGASLLLIEVVIEFKVFLVDLIGPVLNAEDADGGFAVPSSAGAACADWPVRRFA